MLTGTSEAGETSGICPVCAVRGWIWALMVRRSNEWMRLSTSMKYS